MILYYAALGLMWLILWAAAALALGELPWKLPKTAEQGNRRWSMAGIGLRLLNRRRAVFAAIGGAYVLFYVLGYAPTMSAIRNGRLPQPGGMLDFYVPVEWLIDESPLREPLLLWANHWGERGEFESASASRLRSRYWGNASPWLYATGWLSLGIACVIGPAWLLRIAIRRFGPGALSPQGMFTDTPFR